MKIKNNNNLLSLWRSKLRHVNVPDFTGMLAVKGGLPLFSWLLKVARVGVGSTNLSWVKAIRSFLSSLLFLYKKQGLPGVVKTLKVSSVCLQQSVGKMVIKDLTSLGPRIARTKGGLPRIIPIQMRARIRSGDRVVIQVWLSLLLLYRVLEYKGSVKINTITDPGSDVTELLSEFSSVFNSMKYYFKRTPLSRGYNDEMRCNMLIPDPFVILKSSPVSSITGTVSTSQDSLILAARGLLDSPIWPIWKELSQLMALKQLYRLPEILSDLWDTVKTPKEFKRSHLNIGKLALKDEPAGKVRVFAIVDPFTQWLLRPLHDVLFDTLRCFPSDGTHNQIKPVERLLKKGYKRFWCYDLSAATDRLPVSLQELILSKFFGIRFALLWRKLLVDRSYYLKGHGPVRYAVGQPMGALSSWAMLALTHHLIVQWSWYRVLARLNAKSKVKKRTWYWFDDYAVLGDDIVIANGLVAREYLRLMTQLGVQIGLAKSLVSRNGTLEFAKRFFIDSQDASPISLKEMAVSVGSIGPLMEYCRKYNLSFGTLLTLVGYGYRTKGRLTQRFNKMNRRLMHILVMRSQSLFSFLDWLQLERVGTVKTWESWQAHQSLRGIIDIMNSVIYERVRWIAKSCRTSRVWYSLFPEDRPKGDNIYPVVDDTYWRSEFFSFVKAIGIGVDVKRVWTRYAQFFESIPWDYDARKVLPFFIQCRDRLDSISVLQDYQSRPDPIVRDHIVQDMVIWSKIWSNIQVRDLGVIPVKPVPGFWLPFLAWLLIVTSIPMFLSFDFTVPPRVGVISSWVPPLPEVQPLVEPRFPWEWFGFGVLLVVFILLIPTPSAPSLVLDTSAGVVYDPIARFQLGIPGPYSPAEMLVLQDYLEVRAFVENTMVLSPW